MFSVQLVLTMKSNAMAIAQFLDQHEAVKRVLYPGLPSHPQYEIIKQQQHGFGSMITFFCIGNRTQSNLILQNVRICVSLLSYLYTYYSYQNIRMTYHFIL